MSKFLVTGGLLLLLASFLNYPTTPKNDAQSDQPRKEIIIYPISEQIKFARTERHLTQKELADRTGMTKMSIERIEKGQLVPTQDMIAKLEKVLSVELELTGY